MIISKSWDKLLKEEYKKEYFIKMMEKVEELYQKGGVFPSRENLFRAYELTSFEDVKVVIIGQDPYHGKNQANGLAFSVNRDIKIPPSLRNIYKELERDIGFNIPSHGDLSSWAKKGVLLLNTSLCVKESKPASCKNIGFELFTISVINKIIKNKRGVVFLLWGNYAISLFKNIDISRHIVLKSSHPSPLSAYRGFIGCSHFSKTNSYLYDNFGYKIDWRLKDD